MGKMKEVLQDAAEELYPGDYIEQDNFFKRAVNGTLTDKEKKCVSKHMVCKR